MNNLAEVYKFPDKRGDEINQHDTGGYVKADIEQGYDRLAQKLTDTLANPPVKLSAREYQIVFAVISKTYRWQKKNDWMTNTQISSLTGIDSTNIGKIIKGLIAKKVLFRDGKNTGINPVVSDWQEIDISQKQLKTSQKRLAESIPKTSQKRLANSSKPTKKLVENDCHIRKETNTKDNIKKINKKSLLESLDFSTWPAMPSNQIFDDWIAMRKSKKASVSQTVINNFGAQFQIACQNGLSVDECLSECITRNWQGFKYSWIANSNQKSSQSFGSQSSFVGDQLAALQQSVAHIPTPHDDEVL
ncbi:replication protein [Pseudoalteromonas sp. NZS71_1]|uniref:replication protein n=1 Tax=Pseudoalteromonas sp. NZS71_1 TaxID=2792072 RepID=UPI0018CE114B|nr:replication protein [Pseudoalteromonas sp. NZS71_1]MBH0034594.1 replication protein [Pseudoalteromonas sp. NZS71_1]